jgi:ROS/MUCR transcriptional regulator protein
VQCHLCGQWFRWIGGTDLARTHDWTIEEYREAFHLLQRTSTAAHGFSEQRREQLKQRVDAGELVPSDLTGHPRRGSGSLARRGCRTGGRWQLVAPTSPPSCTRPATASSAPSSSPCTQRRPCGGSAGAAATHGEQPRRIGVTSRRVGAPSAQDPRTDRRGAAEPAHWPPARICSPSCTPLSIPGSISHGSPPRATRSSGGCARRAATAGRRRRRFEPAARVALTAPWRATGRRRTSWKPPAHWRSSTRISPPSCTRHAIRGSIPESWAPGPV